MAGDGKLIPHRDASEDEAEYEVAPKEEVGDRGDHDGYPCQGVVDFLLVRTHEFSYDGVPERQVCHSDEYLDHTGAVQFLVYARSAEFEEEHNVYGEYGSNEHPLQE